MLLHRQSTRCTRRQIDSEKSQPERSQRSSSTSTSRDFANGSPGWRAPSTRMAIASPSSSRSSRSSGEFTASHAPDGRCARRHLRRSARAVLRCAAASRSASSNGRRRFAVSPAATPTAHARRARNGGAFRDTEQQPTRGQEMVERADRSGGAYGSPTPIATSLRRAAVGPPTTARIRNRRVGPLESHA